MESRNSAPLLFPSLPSPLILPCPFLLFSSLLSFCLNILRHFSMHWALTFSLFLSLLNQSLISQTLSWRDGWLLWVMTVCHFKETWYEPSRCYLNMKISMFSTQSLWKWVSHPHKALRGSPKDSPPILYCGLRSSTHTVMTKKKEKKKKNLLQSVNANNVL